MRKTKNEVVQQAKATAFNAIRKIYHPKYDKYRNNDWEEYNYAEQRDEKVRDIMDKLEKELIRIKEKYK